MKTKYSPAWGWVLAGLAIIALFLTIPSIAVDSIEIAFAMIVASAFLGLAGSFFRATRTKVLLDYSRSGPISGQFLALSVANLINIVVPFRAGELVRSWLIARQLRTSLLFSFFAVFFERLLDILFVSMIFVGGHFLAGGSRQSLLLGYAIMMLAISSLTLVAVVLLLSKNRLLLKLFWRFTRLWNSSVALRLKVSLWAFFEGIESFLKKPRALLKYTSFALTSWLFLLLAVTLVFSGYGIVISGSNLVTPFLLPETLVRSGAVDQALRETAGWLYAPNATAEHVYQAVLVAWLVLNLPQALIGVAALASRKLLQRVPEPTKPNKFDESRARASHLEEFLDSFYSSEKSKTLVRQLELGESAQLVRFFRGGSDAITFLLESNHGPFVRKVVDKKFQDKLENQFHWLQKFREDSLFVEARRELETEDSYLIDLEYLSDSTQFFDWLHRNPLKASEKHIDQVFSHLFSEVYVTPETPITNAPEMVRTYIQKRLLDRVTLAAESDEGVSDLWQAKRVAVNGEPHPGLREMIFRILNDPLMQGDLAAFSQSQYVHGDLTIDNMLVRPSGDIVIIDPSDDNEIRGPIIDFARILQSLEGGYEFINDLDGVEVEVSLAKSGLPEVTFPTYRTEQYEALAHHVRQIASKRLNQSENRALNFHIGLFFGRMLQHRISIRPKTAPAYFGLSLVFMKRFIDSYE